MSPAIRLVVCDVDGTLVDSHKKLTQPTIDAVARLKDAAIGFTIISARPMSGMLPIADALGLDEAMGAFNGGTIFRRDGTIDAQQYVPRQIVEEVFALVGDAAVDRWVFAGDRWYASSDRGEHVEHECLASNQQPILTTDFTPYLDTADKLTFISDDAGLLGDLHTRASDAVGARVTVVQSQSYYLDITARAANKGDGITALARTMDTPLAATLAIGDQANDLAMFERAGMSIAMGQAPDAVKAKAASVTASNDADGVARAIDELLTR